MDLKKLKEKYKISITAFEIAPYAYIKDRLCYVA